MYNVYNSLDQGKLLEQGRVASINRILKNMRKGRI